MYLFFETDTIGLPHDWGAPASDLKNWPRLIRITWMWVDRQEDVQDQQSRIFKPSGFRIPKSSTLMHGITTENAEQQGEPAAVILKDFQASFQKARYLVAHNLIPHIRGLKAEFIRAGLTLDTEKVLSLCTMKTTTHFCALQSKDGSLREPSLQQLYQRLFRSSTPASESPFATVMVLRDCFFELQKQAVLPLPS